MTSSPQLVIANASRFDDEELKGRPRSVRTERRELFAQDDGTLAWRPPYLTGIAEYRSDGKATERQSFRPDGSIAYQDTYEYSNDGRLEVVRTMDAAGREIQRVRYLGSTKVGVEEEIIINANGQEIERTITQSDETGRLLESTVVKPGGEIIAHMDFKYDEQGRFVGSKVTSQETPELDIDVGYQADGSAVQTARLPGGLIVGTSTERIDARDEQGNWTKKTILPRDTDAQTMTQPIAEVYRLITYYGEERLEV